MNFHWILRVAFFSITKIPEPFSRFYLSFSKMLHKKSVKISVVPILKLLYLLRNVNCAHSREHFIKDYEQREEKEQMSEIKYNSLLLDYQLWTQIPCGHEVEQFIKLKLLKYQICLFSLSWYCRLDKIF